MSPSLTLATRYASVTEGGGGTVYEVEPEGPLTLDADPILPAGCHAYCAPSARVVRIVRRVREASMQDVVECVRDWERVAGTRMLDVDDRFGPLCLVPARPAA